MSDRSINGGRHELGQNHLHHRPTIDLIAALVRETAGPILEIGAGDGALTRVLARLDRPLLAIELDEHRVAQLRRRLPEVQVRHADVLRHPFDRPVVVGNLPFHLTTPILRKLLSARAWRDAVLLTQWEVARKRAGVGGGTLMGAQAAPWFTFRLHGRVPARHFTPIPSVDGGVWSIRRRDRALVPFSERRAYEEFARRAFTGRGRGIHQILHTSARWSEAAVRRTLAGGQIAPDALPRDLTADQWVHLWTHRPVG